MNQILYSHQAVSPILYGVKTPGQLGTTNEFENAFKILDKVVIENDRMILEDSINYLTSFNNIGKVTIKPFVVFEQNLIKE